LSGRVLIACEFSGVVRRAFEARGYDAWSSDLRRAEDGSNRHYTGDVRDILYDGWDMMVVAHPPCTRLCNSGARWLTAPPPGRTLPDMWAELDEGAELFSTLWNAPVPRIAVENPVMHKHAKARIVNYRPAAQSVQPWEYGDWETKRTCLWLRGLPRLEPIYTTLDEARRGMGLEADAMPAASVHRHTGWGAKGADRAKNRSRFFDGIANAMADQWGNLLDVRAVA
jgi:hypothetical protein